MEQGILTGLGLAPPAGLNAWLTLLLVGLADRYTGLIELPADYDWISSTPGLAALAVAFAVETVVDKIPGADHLNDLVQTLIRPTAGAVLMLATTQGDLSPTVAAVVGLVLAGAAHATKASARPVVTLSTGGFGNPVISLVEDVIAAAAVFLALVVPLLAVLVLLVLFVGSVWGMIAWRRRRARSAAAEPQPG